jgi:hypothetical protein
VPCRSHEHVLEWTERYPEKLANGELRIYVLLKEESFAFLPQFFSHHRFCFLVCIQRTDEITALLFIYLCTPAQTQALRGSLTWFQRNSGEAKKLDRYK